MATFRAWSACVSEHSAHSWAPPCCMVSWVLSWRREKQILYNHPPKGRCNSGKIHQDAKRRGIYLALWTEPEGDSSFSIFTKSVGWKWKKKKLVNKRRHLVRVFLRCKLKVFRGSFFYDFVAKSVRNFFSTDQLTSTSQILSLSWYLLEQLLHLPLKFHLTKLSGNEKPFWIPSQKSEFPRIFRVTGANQNTRKSLSTDWWILKYKVLFVYKVLVLLPILGFKRNIRAAPNTNVIEWNSSPFL